MSTPTKKPTSPSPELTKALKSIATLPEAPKAYTSESSKWKHLAAPYLTGNGIELATGGDPISPTSIQFELTPPTYAHYNSNQPLRGVVHWRSDDAIFNLPFKDGVLDYVASSHLLEDFVDWTPLLKEWVRVLKSGGTLLVCLPEKKRWDAYVAVSGRPNCAHQHELRYIGELSEYAPKLGLSIVCEKFTETPPRDHNVMFVARKV